MKRKHLLPSLVRRTIRTLPVAALLLATSCSDITEDGNRLPDGTYPMTFTAAVDGLTTTRATTVDNTWAGGEEVAIQAGEEVKKYTAASNGNLTVATSGTPFYWQRATESKTVSAWYSHVYLDKKPTTFSVQVDQNSSNGYQTSDFLYAAPQNFTYISGSGSTELTFMHLPAKVVVNLKNGEGVTAGEVTAATVSIVNQATTSGTILPNGIVTLVDGATTITPMKLTAAPDYQQRVQALLVPQQMRNKKFVKVTIGTGTAAECDYYYTPTYNDAYLETGKQYTYNIIVKKTGLEVTVTGKGTSWTDVTVTGSTDPTTRFQIIAPATGVTIAAATGSGGTLKDNGSGSYTLSGGNEITITNDVRIGIKGLYAVADDNITYTLKSDLLITYSLDNAQVGDFYCKSGDGSDGYLIPGDVSSLTEAQQQACIGIVYCTDVSRMSDATKQALSSKSVTPHGLVMALTNASESCQWGNYGKDENSGGSEGEPFYDNTTTLAKQYRNVDGCGETRWIIDNYKNNGTTLQNTYTAFYHANRYGTAESNTAKYAAPDNTTGWFIPGMGQWWDILSNLGEIDLSSYRNSSESNTYISGATTTAVANLNTYLAKINGATTFSTNTYFWSSSEYGVNGACYVYFTSNGYLGLRYDDKNYSKYSVRCSFAF